MITRMTTVQPLNPNVTISAPVRGPLSWLTAPFHRVRRSSLATNALWTLLGNLIYAGCQWGMLSALARTMPVEAVGRFAIALAVSAPVVILSQLQLRAAQATDSKGAYQVRQYVTLRCVMALVGLAAIAIICMVAKYDTATLEVIGLISVAKTVESISDILFGVFQQQEQMAYMGKSLILKGLLSISAFGLLIVTTHNLNLACLGLVVAWSGVLVAYDIRWARRLAGNLLRHSAEGVGKTERSISLAGCGGLFKATLPLGIASYLYTLTPNLPRYILDSFAGRSQLGIYAAITYVVIAGTTVVTALGTAVTPRLAQAFANKEKDRFLLITFTMFGLATAIGLAMLALVAATGSTLLKLLYGAKYSGYQDLFLWVIGTGAVGYGASILGYAVVATRRFNAQVPIHASVAVTTFLGCWFLIPRFGTVGATWGVLCGSVVGIVASCVVIYSSLFGFAGEGMREKQFTWFPGFQKAGNRN